MSRVRSNIRHRQTVRSFDVDGVVSDFPDRLYPTPFLVVLLVDLHVTFYPRLGHCKRRILHMSSEPS